MNLVTVAATYRSWIESTGFAILSEDFKPEGTGGHSILLAQRGN